MTLARVIYLIMEIGKEYTITDIEVMVWKWYWKYRNAGKSADWMEGWYNAPDREKAAREALRASRQYGYTTYKAVTIPAHDMARWLHPYRGRKYLKVYHYKEYTEYRYIRVK